MRISVAKRRSRHSVPQDGINALIVAHVKTGAIVVRLKGGDPFIFGRGGEEVEAVRAAGLPVEVIPGVSAALGCAAEAMLPLTHRDHSSAVSFVAGQCKGLTDQDWSGLAGQGRTLVIYMGVATATDIADKLMSDGVAPDMPVAVLERGTLAGARAMKTLLADLGPMVAREDVQSPAIIVVGEVVELSDAEDKLARWAALSGDDGMKLLTGNDLASGDVVWWTGSEWSRHVEDAADVGDQGDALAQAEEGARRVNVPYVIDGEMTVDGPRPAHIKDRVRALGPTVRPDLTLKPADPQAGNWVI